MNHIPFEFICRIADGDTLEELSEYSTHLTSCKMCQWEVELQRSIIATSSKAKLLNPSQNFTKNVLEVIQPMKHHWYEKLLQNLGNVIAMVSVLAFLAYIFSLVSSSGLQIDKPSDSKLVTEATMFIAEGTRQITNFFASNAILVKSGEFHINTILFGFIAIVILIFLDKLAQGLSHRSRN
jgi:hypothetical protein